ncbi:MAG: hypothetical protein NC412_11240 [Roseburia sp.]|nr:hypothetical protein [Roseburia sp.]MCM1279949.1 hypothetical protein [Robinsoniella sp.]
MSSVCAVCKYETEKLLKSRKWMVPAILLIMYLGMSYSVGPLDILSSFGICSLVVFLGMLAVFFMCNDIHAQTMDQTVFIRISNKKSFYTGKVLLVGKVSMIGAAVSILVPVIQYVVNGKDFFTSSFTAGKGVSGFILFFLCGFCGGMTALLLNDRLVPKKEASIALCILAALLAIVKGGLHEKFPVTKLVSWVLPPLYDLSYAYSHGSDFLFRDTGIYFLWMLFYLVLQILFYVWVMDKKRFE